MYLLKVQTWCGNILIAAPNLLQPPQSTSIDHPCLPEIEVLTISDNVLLLHDHSLLAETERGPPVSPDRDNLDFIEV